MTCQESKTSRMTKENHFLNMAHLLEHESRKKFIVIQTREIVVD